MFIKISKNNPTTEYYGSSAEVKPIPTVVDGQECTLYETDTRRMYLWENNEWVLNRNITLRDFRKISASLDQINTEIAEIKEQINQ